MQSTTPPLPSMAHAFHQLVAEIPDPRSPRGRRYPFRAFLTAATAAMLANHRSILAIAEWTAALCPAAKQALGLPPGAAPHQTTFARLFRRFDPTLLAQLLTAAHHPRCAQELPARGSQGVAMDGKAQRGRRTLAGPPVHAVSLVTHDTAAVLAQTPLTAPTDSEAAVVLPLLAQVPWQGRVLTGDALYCQTAFCQTVIAAGGDYLLSVKANQPTLLRDIQWLFAEPRLLDDLRTARTVSKGHGRIEERVIRVSSDLADYSRWPGLAQVFELTRTWQDAAGCRHQATSYGVTSLPAHVADALRILGLKRGHWTIENRVHWIKDEVLGEDASRIRCDHGPSVMALLRDTVLNLIRRAGHSSVAAALRAYSRDPHAALALVGCRVAEHA